MRVRSVGLGFVTLAVGTVAGYLQVWRRPCLMWGATPEEFERVMPGDEFLLKPHILATRAITIGAPPSLIWPWLMQMGSGKGGVYTYDWIENLFGLRMHSAREILPQFQDRAVGDTEQLGKNGPRLRVEILERERAMVLRSEDGNWVWSFGLYPSDALTTRFISRNRIATPGAKAFQRVFNTLVLEPGSLIMERKMLLGIKERAEDLQARQTDSEATK